MENEIGETPSWEKMGLMMEDGMGKLEVYPSTPWYSGVSGSNFAPDVGGERRGEKVGA